MLNYIKSLPSDYKLASSNTGFQATLEYSLALYELEDISNYSDNISVVDSEDSELSRLMSLSDEQLESIIQSYVKGEVGTDGYRYRYRYMYTFVEDLYNISLDKVQTLESMAQQLYVMERNDDDHNNTDKRKESVVLDDEEKELVDDAFPPEWNDVVVAHQYQLIGKEIVKCLGNTTDITAIYIQPCQCVNGLMYHRMRFEHHHQQQNESMQSRFAINIRYLDDLVTGVDTLPSLLTNSAQRLEVTTNKCNCNGQGTAPTEIARDQYTVAVDILDIIELTERLDNHSGFRVSPDEVKVVIATNAAESSITLPDVDVVICLGTHKSMRYVKQNHYVQLVNTWISKASATQRAGRTCLVPPGSKTVTRHHFVITVHVGRYGLEGGVSVLMDFLEPPYGQLGEGLRLPLQR
eukprot:gene6112-12377_t